MLTSNFFRGQKIRFLLTVLFWLVLVAVICFLSLLLSLLLPRFVCCKSWISFKCPCEELGDELKLDSESRIFCEGERSLRVSPFPPRDLLGFEVSNLRTMEATDNGTFFVVLESELFSLDSTPDNFRPITGLLEAEGIFSIRSRGSLQLRQLEP